MSGTFETGASSIDLSGSPWNVTGTISVYVRSSGGEIALFKDAACTEALSPPNLAVPYDQPTGLYFYIAASSTSGTLFCDGLAGQPQPVVWGGGAHDCPATVTYGKILESRLAFSMKDLAHHANDVSHSFDLMIELPGGRHATFTSFVKEDPTIIEKGEEPSG